ncbi:MAG: hypothetical protein KAK00_03115 [Nanoarchaeota archaeon]|nr:hypothetical protein [Nanoarchaeota archaeon]
MTQQSSANTDKIFAKLSIIFAEIAVVSFAISFFTIIFVHVTGLEKIPFINHIASIISYGFILTIYCLPPAIIFGLLESIRSLWLGIINKKFDKWEIVLRIFSIFAGFIFLYVSYLIMKGFHLI